MNWNIIFTLIRYIKAMELIFSYKIRLYLHLKEMYSTSSRLALLPYGIVVERFSMNTDFAADYLTFYVFQTLTFVISNCVVVIKL